MRPERPNLRSSYSLWCLCLTRACCLLTARAAVSFACVSCLQALRSAEEALQEAAVTSLRNIRLPRPAGGCFDPAVAIPLLQEARALWRDACAAAAAGTPVPSCSPTLVSRLAAAAGGDTKQGSGLWQGRPAAGQQVGGPGSTRPTAAAAFHWDVDEYTGASMAGGAPTALPEEVAAWSRLAAPAAVGLVLTLAAGAAAKDPALQPLAAAAAAAGVGTPPEEDPEAAELEQQQRTQEDNLAAFTALDKALGVGVQRAALGLVGLSLAGFLCGEPVGTALFLQAGGAQALLAVVGAPKVPPRVRTRALWALARSTRSPVGCDIALGWWAPPAGSGVAASNPPAEGAIYDGLVKLLLVPHKHTQLPQLISTVLHRLRAYQLCAALFAGAEALSSGVGAEGEWGAWAQSAAAAAARQLTALIAEAPNGWAEGVFDRDAVRASLVRADPHAALPASSILSLLHQRRLVAALAAALAASPPESEFVPAAAGLLQQLSTSRGGMLLLAENGAAAAAATRALDAAAEKCPAAAPAAAAVRGALLALGSFDLLLSSTKEGRKGLDDTAKQTEPQLQALWSLVTLSRRPEHRARVAAILASPAGVSRLLDAIQSAAKGAAEETGMAPAIALELLLVLMTDPAPASLRAWCAAPTLCRHISSSPRGWLFA